MRPLTTQERARLQTFPQNYEWIGSKTDIEQMIGNAVPVKLAEFIANRIVEYHNLPQKENKAKRNESYQQLELNLEQYAVANNPNGLEVFANTVT